MNLKEYLSVRRAYNKVRQAAPSATRLTFEEMAILCQLDDQDAPVCTSDIATYQSVLRPTMTHRTNHLASLGLISREAGTEDRRNVCCSISAKGRKAMLENLGATCDQIPLGQPLCRAGADRMVRYFDAMGEVFCDAGELILIAVDSSVERACTITELLKELGLLQPTISMSVHALEARGLVCREVYSETSRRSLVKLTDEGTRVARDFEDEILAVIVRRPRGTSEVQR
ncbi:MAG: MarR family transcriptional regulator [Atopobiaceae bacterium]|jgi:DNA-binding MarR family transcriptional regulator|nr:MarR family transcriptional regulator [Atopobiaceae bacterium]MCH4230330.1 MarR family transcriptional regulator [Atopobiaceae bacterium]MCH4277028.1 MarR family transcriptional regulator [Atopobiaceae bacterium]MCI1227002.1 MarR family transcriptional regulator [Atopobiaceae bacterium]MCI1260592.1 MarR family transcriptional regulator [Atopobiaceae bacterium]